jgi:DedD protein
MDLLSAFKRKKPAAPDAADDVRQARTRARQRLIGAAVLVVAGIVGFPLLFETQPRPIPVDLPIDIPRQDSAAPLVLSPSPASAARSESLPAAKSDRVGDRVIDETSADAGRELAPAASTSAAAGQGASASEAARAAARAPAEAASKAKPSGATATSAAVPKTTDAAADDGARAKSLLEGKTVASGPASPPAPAAAGTARFVVQVGAFADAAAVKATRAKVERLGLVTYTQVAETPAGARTRVRVGPFSTRAEAERAAARIKAADLPTVILTL